MKQLRTRLLAIGLDLGATLFVVAVAQAGSSANTRTRTPTRALVCVQEDGTRRDHRSPRNMTTTTRMIASINRAPLTI